MSPAALLRTVRALPWSGRIGLFFVVFWLLTAAIGPLLEPYPPGAFVSREVFAEASVGILLAALVSAEKVPPSVGDDGVQHPVASVKVARCGVRKETSGVVLKLFQKDAFCRDFADHLSVCRA